MTRNDKTSDNAEAPFLDVKSKFCPCRTICQVPATARRPSILIGRWPSPLTRKNRSTDRPQPSNSREFDLVVQSQTSTAAERSSHQLQTISFSPFRTPPACTEVISQLFSPSFACIQDIYCLLPCAQPPRSPPGGKSLGRA